MVVKKPYAFLIKHFKIIHLLLLVPILYIAFKFGDIASFFQAYVKANYHTIETNIAGNYVTLLMFFALLLLILSSSIIILLLKSKKKNTLLYSCNVVYYFILIIFSMISYGVMSGIEIDSTFDATIMNFFRDISRILVIPSYILMIIHLGIGIGFNIKTFRLDNHVNLQVTEEDDEEIEIKIGPDKYTTKRTIVHGLRELKYYFLENKFVFTCIGAVLLVIILFSTYMNFQVYNKKYNLYQAFALDTFTMTLKESYLSNVDYAGNKIEKDYYYLAVKINIYNKSKNAASIDKANFRIFIGDEVIYPSYDRSNRFIDIGNSYQGNSIFPDTEDDYVLVYELTKEQVVDRYQMKILSGLKQEPGKLIPSYKIINIKPTKVLEKETIFNSDIGKQITLEDTLLSNTKYRLTNLELKSFYQYEYEQCTGVNMCTMVKTSKVPQSGNALVVIEDTIEWDESTSYYKNTSRDLYADFGTIEYEFNGKKYKAKLKSTNGATPNNKKFYEVPSNILYASNIDLIITIRNKEIKIYIKD